MCIPGRKTAENLPAHSGRLHRQDRNGSLGQENGGNPVRTGKIVLFGHENDGKSARNGVGCTSRAEAVHSGRETAKNLPVLAKTYRPGRKTAKNLPAPVEKFRSGRKTAENLPALAERPCPGRKTAEILPALPSAGRRRSRLRPKRLSRKRSGPPSLRPLTRLVPCASGEYVRMAEKKNTGRSYSIQVMSAVFWKGLSSRPITMAVHSVCTLSLTIVRSVSSFQT